MKFKPFVSLLAAAALGLPATVALAQATPEQIASLGGEERTCFGAERAGNAEGTIPEFSGKWYKTWPGQSRPHGYEPGPYADDEPLFKLDGHVFRPGEYVTVRETDGESLVFRIVSVR